MSLFQRALFKLGVAAPIGVKVYGGMISLSLQRKQDKRKDSAQWPGLLLPSRRHGFRNTVAKEEKCRRQSLQWVVSGYIRSFFTCRLLVSGWVQSGRLQSIWSVNVMNPAFWSFLDRYLFSLVRDQCDSWHYEAASGSHRSILSSHHELRKDRQNLIYQVAGLWTVNYGCVNPSIRFKLPRYSYRPILAHESDSREE